MIHMIWPTADSSAHAIAVFSQVTKRFATRFFRFSAASIGLVLVIEQTPHGSKFRQGASTRPSRARGTPGLCPLVMWARQIFAVPVLSVHTCIWGLVIRSTETQALAYRRSV